MSWLKEWDQCVFKDQMTAAQRKKKNMLKRSREGSLPGSEADKENLDPLGRPREKVRRKSLSNNH